MNRLHKELDTFTQGRNRYRPLPAPAWPAVLGDLVVVRALSGDYHFPALAVAVDKRGRVLRILRNGDTIDFGNPFDGFGWHSCQVAPNVYRSAALDLGPWSSYQEALADLLPLLRSFWHPEIFRTAPQTP